MRLFEHPDFEQAVIRAPEHFRTLGLRAAIIEQDYLTPGAPQDGGETAFASLGGYGKMQAVRLFSSKSDAAQPWSFDDDQCRRPEPCPAI